MIAIDLVGVRFGKLTVLERAGLSRHCKAVWLCKCDCGREKTVVGGSLKSGLTRSCGCDSCIKPTHRLSHTLQYKAWQGMHNRCTNSASDAYEDYGGRGVRVCERWSYYENFLEDMGVRPNGMSIERIDVNGNYEPGNCRWATSTEQASNKRSSVFVVVGGKRMTLAQACRETGVSKSTIKARVKRGLTPQEALSIGGRV